MKKIKKTQTEQMRSPIELICHWSCGEICEQMLIFAYKFMRYFTNFRDKVSCVSTSIKSQPNGIVFASNGVSPSEMSCGGQTTPSMNHFVHSKSLYTNWANSQVLWCKAMFVWSTLHFAFDEWWFHLLQTHWYLWYRGGIGMKTKC